MVVYLCVVPSSDPGDLGVGFGLPFLYSDCLDCDTVVQLDEYFCAFFIFSAVLEISVSPVPFCFSLFLVSLDYVRTKEVSGCGGQIM